LTFDTKANTDNVLMNMNKVVLDGKEIKLEMVCSVHKYLYLYLVKWNLYMYTMYSQIQARPQGSKNARPATPLAENMRVLFATGFPISTSDDEIKNVLSDLNSSG
jgi:hypothetical protein